MTEDEADKIVEKMFDQMIEATPKEGKIGGRTLLDEALKGDEMAAACERMVITHRKFDRLNDDPRKYHDPDVNLCWWHALNAMAEAERKVWRLFVGPHPTLTDNIRYATWRNSYLRGLGIKVDA